MHGYETLTAPAETRPHQVWSRMPSDRLRRFSRAISRPGFARVRTMLVRAERSRPACPDRSRQPRARLATSRAGPARRAARG